MPVENKKCEFRSNDDQQCRRWAIHGSNFCYNHKPELRWGEEDFHLHPLARLATPEDLFDVIRETLNAARQGRIAPGQAYAVCQLALLWLQLYKTLRTEHGHQTAVAELFGEPARHRELPVRPLPLPVKIDEEASTEAPPPARSAEEAHQRMQEAMATLPPLHTVEQRAELHRQVAEIEARSKARLAADSAARNSALSPDPSPLSPAPATPRDIVRGIAKRLLDEAPAIVAAAKRNKPNGAAKSKSASVGSG